jgi:UDP-N-acetylmuramoyl-tripeptide--D-alanyl-D-alanine ligase
VGGSNGKTSTKELIRAALGARLTVHATQGNLNNQIGVPLTLLSLPDNAHIAVIEVGTNTPGEIALLRAIVEPNIAVVTAVQEEHLEGFGDLAGVLREETALLNGAPTAVVPADDQTLTAEARRRAERTVTAGLEAGDIRSSAHGLEPDGSGWLEFDGARITVPLRGEHNLRNTILALAVARECGVSAAAAGAAFASIDLAALPQMRSDISALGAGLLINDAYNSNPGSARAALALLNTVGAGRQRVAIFGTMRELGTQSSRAHRELARAVLDSDTELIAGIGEFGTALNALAGEEGRDDRVITASDVEELWPALAPRMAPGAAILLKASRGVRLERILPHLSTWADGQGL